MAATPKGGKPDGEWYKWDGENFTKPGLGGATTPIWSSDKYAGAYPTISYNTYLKSYVMLFSGWGEEFYYSFSTNLTQWSTPVELSLPPDFPKLSKDGEKWHLWYGTLIGSSSNFSDATAKFYFAHIKPDKDNSKTIRKFYQADVTFTGVSVGDDNDNGNNDNSTGGGCDTLGVGLGLLCAVALGVPFVRRENR
ncbi:hypothetical protein FACS1894204_01180 [Synergistales bacterium]|nr:hypothetical protein FACS1894204_01180 [Synergistales bacterium]